MIADLFQIFTRAFLLVRAEWTAAIKSVAESLEGQELQVNLKEDFEAKRKRPVVSIDS